MSASSYRWVGSEQPFLDTPTMTEQHGIHIGWYGGHTGAGYRSRRL